MTDTLIITTPDGYGEVVRQLLIEQVKDVRVVLASPGKCHTVGTFTVDTEQDPLDVWDKIVEAFERNGAPRRFSVIKFSEVPVKPVPIWAQPLGTGAL